MRQRRQTPFQEFAAARDRLVLVFVREGIDPWAVPLIRLLRRLLCRVGVHAWGWDVRIAPPGGDGPWLISWRCAACGRKRTRAVD